MAEIRKGTDDEAHFVCFVRLSLVVKAWLGNNDRSKSNAVRIVKKKSLGIAWINSISREAYKRMIGYASVTHRIAHLFRVAIRKSKGAITAQLLK
ncbi:hypothetical protein CEXT_392571 [Caerostris extrusa]|uniref:Ribosomal protein L20 n=1 Tax=Caerostris extrusa TaxID=172846 RepID=A0AAV4NCU6_CAEEX|nr:hypothetical protein CEXT_392571 [Caerostris extrusa]